jgi:iron-sulfur cluster repair protein YtfE (RIC family)
MVVIHRAMRQDLQRLVDCLGGIPARGLPPARARAISRYTAALLAEISAHHDNEDGILWPLIAATAGQSVDLTPLTDDHQALEVAAGRVSQVLASFGGNPAPSAVALHASVSDLCDLLDEHIADEEEQIFPVMRRYLPAEAYGWCEHQIQRKAPLSGLRFTAPWPTRILLASKHHDE